MGHNEGFINLNQPTRDIIDSFVKELAIDRWKTEQLALLLAERLNKKLKEYSSPRNLSLNGLETNSGEYDNVKKEYLGIIVSPD